VILLDTHVLIWARADSKRLSRAAASAIRRARDNCGLAISAISLWELASLFATRKITGVWHGTVETSVGLLIEDVTVRPITAEIAALAAQFPDDYSRDRSDRLIGGDRARRRPDADHPRRENPRKPLLRTVW